MARPADNFAEGGPDGTGLPHYVTVGLVLCDREERFGWGVAIVRRLYGLLIIRLVVLPNRVKMVVSISEHTAFLFSVRCLQPFGILCL